VMAGSQSLPRFYGLSPFRTDPVTRRSSEADARRVGDPS
jgi:hypothetical protein